MMTKVKIVGNGLPKQTNVCYVANTSWNMSGAIEKHMKIIHQYG